MHVHIAMMGQATEPVIKSFQALGYDRLYIVVGRKFEDSVSRVKSAMSPFGVEVGVEYVSGFDFQEVVNAIYRIYESESGGGNVNTFSINITGGTNLMAAASCSCAFFIGATIYYVMMGDGPVKDQVVPIPTPKTPNMAILKPETRQILSFILKETECSRPVTTAKLMDEFGKTKQSLNYQINVLRREGLVENGDGVKEDGSVDRRYRTLILTPQGRLIASWI